MKNGQRANVSVKHRTSEQTNTDIITAVVPRSIQSVKRLRDCCLRFSSRQKLTQSWNKNTKHWQK